MNTIQGNGFKVKKTVKVIYLQRIYAHTKGASKMINTMAMGNLNQKKHLVTKVSGKMINYQAMVNCLMVGKSLKETFKIILDKD